MPHHKKSLQDLFVTKLDLFGRKVSLNIDRKGEEHKTIVGALVSIIVYCMYISYTQQCIAKIWNGSDDKNTFNIVLNNITSINYVDQNLSQFYILGKKSG